MAALVGVLGGAGTEAAFAQTPAPTGPPPMTLRADFAFYGDNTEFFNQFRDGETLLGVWARLFVDVAIDSHTTLRVGAFGNRRFASDDVFALARPVCALVMTKGSSRFVLGTLETMERRDGIGPDRTGTHGLLPPIQAESLAFTRPYEAGLQWTVTSKRVSQDAWLSWQKINTVAHRESFDAGIVGRAVLGGPVQVGYQAHVVHHGGQLFAAGPVGDSYAFAPGIIVRGRGDGTPKAWMPSAELYWVRSSDNPSRAEPDGRHTGNGGFFRFALEYSGWRVHAIVWRACDFIKAEGDANYGSERLADLPLRATRDYAEAGLTHMFLTSDRMYFEGSVRLHRIEDSWNYSYRVLARVNLAVAIKR